MATPKERKNKNGPSKWQIVIRKAGCGTITGTYDTEEEAKKFAKETEDRIEAERKAFAAPNPALPPSGKLEDEKLLHTITLFRSTGPCITRHTKLLPTIVKHIGEVTIGQLTANWIDDYFACMRKQITRRKTFYADESIVAQLRMINVVIKWRTAKLNVPTPRFEINTKKLPQGWAKERTRRLSAQEEQLLMSRLQKIKGPSQPHWMLLVRLAIETGARLQELVFAEWNEISPDADFWTIPLPHTKCKKERVMPFTSGAVEIIKQLWKLADPLNPRIFHTLKNPRSVTALFHRWSVSAGLVDFRFHDLRHEGISRFVLTQRNFTVHEIMKMVGHSSPKMLERYMNLRGNELAQKIIRAARPGLTTKLRQPKDSNPTQPMEHLNMSSMGVNPFGFNFADLNGHHYALRTTAPVFNTAAAPLLGVATADAANQQGLPVVA
jgi:integrase